MANSDPAIVLPVQGSPLHMSAVEIEPTVSHLTGQTLRRYQLSFIVAGDMRNDEVQALLSAASDGSQLLSATEGGLWKVANRSVSFQNGSQMYHHTAEVEEQEQLALTAVEIDGMPLTPERWKLDSSGMLILLVSLDSAENDRLEGILERHLFSDADETYFPVTLIGVSETPMSWRFGECLWEQLPDGAARQLLRLVPAAYDDEHGDGGPGLFQPERTRLTQQSVLTKLRLDALIKELQAAGVLSPEALERINPHLTAVPFAEMREFNRANDLDEYFD